MNRLKSCTFLLLVLLLALPASAQIAPSFEDYRCEVPDNGTGTIDLPGEGCAFATPDGQFFTIVDGLPPGSTIEVHVKIQGFHCLSPAGNDVCYSTPGGLLGGEFTYFDAAFVMDMVGTGDLAGFNRVITMPSAFDIHTGPRTPGDATQTFSATISTMYGAMAGDPDFDFLEIRGGATLTLSGLGITTLTELSGGSFEVDSFFDITYEIEFVGAPGGQLDGLGGTTTSTAHVEMEGLRDRCNQPDDGSGTAALPPVGCDYRSANNDPFVIVDGLPPGTTMELTPYLMDPTCASPPCETAGGALGGNIQSNDYTLLLQVKGTGALDGYRRNLRIPAMVGTTSGPRTPGTPTQHFATEMDLFYANMLPGDPDFASLSISSGAIFGFPSYGATVLEHQGDGSFNVDSFFDINYQVDFVGAPGGALDGLGGSTQGSLALVAKDEITPGTAEDDGESTATLPPEETLYRPVGEHFEIIDGLPPGTTIELVGDFADFTCLNLPCGSTGGGLGGNQESFETVLEVALFGTGDLLGFQRNLSIPTSIMTESGPRILGATGIARDLTGGFGTLLGDPDFDSLTITLGSGNGLPAPGHTTINSLPTNDFQVDSFFDITYQIDFAGAPGGALDGLSGSTLGTLRLTNLEDPGASPRSIRVILDAVFDSATDFGFNVDAEAFTLDDDSDPTRQNFRFYPNLLVGNYPSTMDALPSDWQLETITIDDPDGQSTSDILGMSLDFEVDAGEDVVGTFQVAETCPGALQLTLTVAKGVVDRKAPDSIDLSWTPHIGCNFEVFSSSDPSDFTLGLLNTVAIPNYNHSSAGSPVFYTINPVDDDPIAVDDTATVDDGATVNIDLAGNDSDIDQGLDLGSIVVTTPPTEGGLLDLGDGTLDYTHTGAAGPDSFKYTIDDLTGATSNEATVDITINSTRVVFGNDMPFVGPGGIGPGELRAIPVNIPVIFNLTDFGIITIVPGSAVQMGLYDDAGGVPGALIVELPPHAVPNPDTYEFSVTPTPLPAGDYWIAATFDIPMAMGTDPAMGPTFLIPVVFGDPMPPVWAPTIPAPPEFFNFYLVGN